MPHFSWFVIPFILGLLSLIASLLIIYIKWFILLPKDQRQLIRKKIFTFQSISAIKEVIMECLLHRRIFKTNPLLGYMHASLAFGWFLLILAGNWECRIFYHEHISLPYFPIFFRFFNPHPIGFHQENFFSFIMDFLLIIVLSGVILAWIKRLKSKHFGMKSTTKLNLGDKVALYALWFVFPFRLMAEGLSSACYGGGHFLTHTFGYFFNLFLPVHQLVYPAWFLYSLSLGIFFICLPYSRYMHIPTEIVLIFLRKYGVSEQNIFTSFTKVQIYACSRCGICIDPCQLSSNGINNGKIQSVYFLQQIRYEGHQKKNSSQCMMCGRCDEACPVGIDIKTIRQSERNNYFKQSLSSVEHLKAPLIQKTDVVYFSGCMGKLLPSVTHSMISLLKLAQVNFWHMDQDISICCGRPLLLAGKKFQALELMAKNREMIRSSHARTLVTSCPICYNMFKNNLECEVMHHSQYLLRLVHQKKINLIPQNISAFYHDPCELGQGSGIYDETTPLVIFHVTIEKAYL